MSFEQEIKEFLKESNTTFLDGTSSHEELDFALPIHNIYFDAKEKKQRFNMQNWKDANIPEEHFFILDDLAARKVLLKAPRSFVLIRDTAAKQAYYVFSVVDLLCMPKKRVRRELNKQSRTYKGKWYMDFRHGAKFDTLDHAMTFMTEYPNTFHSIFSEHIDCWGEYTGEHIRQAGTPRKPEHWKEDLKLKS